MLVLLAHTLIGLFFVTSGIMNIYQWRSTMELLIQRNLPHPWALLSLGITWQTIAGLFIVFSLFVKLAALSLIPFTIIAVLIGHPFWKFSGDARKIHLGFFITNFTVTLGALILLLNTATPVTQWVDLIH